MNISQREMCRAYGIDRATYRKRKTKGLTIEKCLTTPVKKMEKEATDHVGNKYTSIKEMCTHYGIKYYTYLKRINKGLSTEEALTKPVGK